MTDVNGVPGMGDQSDAGLHTWICMNFHVDSLKFAATTKGVAT